MTAVTLRLKSQSRIDAASVPVQAPVPGLNNKKKGNEDTLSLLCFRFYRLYVLFQAPSKETTNDWFISAPLQDTACKEENNRYGNHIAITPIISACTLNPVQWRMEQHHEVQQVVPWQSKM